MKTVIVGAGSLGFNLSNVLSNDKHDVVLVESSTSNDDLDQINSSLDIMTVNGNGAKASVLKEAGADKADLFIAASGDDSTNILACKMAKILGSKKTFCRLSENDFFLADSFVTAQNFGVDCLVVPVEECLKKIEDILDESVVLEKIFFNVKDAMMASVKVLNGSQLAGIKLMDFPDKELLHYVRIAGIVRDGELKIPDGYTVIAPDDELYIAGSVEKVEKMIDWFSFEKSRKDKIIIAGATKVGRRLAQSLSQKKIDVRVIEHDKNKGEELLYEIGGGLVVVNGNSTDQEVLLESGIDYCDAFVSTLDSDEENILSCILAKKAGAEKVITVTKKTEYTEIIPSLSTIDSCFNSSFIAMNSILRQLNLNEKGVNGVASVMQRINGSIREYEVTEKSLVCNKKIGEIKFPRSTVLAMVFRGGKVIAASGDLLLKKGDITVSIVTSENSESLEKIFSGKKTFF